MIRKGMTIEEATREWVNSMNAIPQGVLEKLQRYSGYADVEEITPPSVCDYVYILSGEHDGEHGEIVSHQVNDDEEIVYTITLDSTNEDIELTADEFEVEHDSGLPMWDTMWSFSDSCDEWWLSDDGGLQIMADCGFRIYEQEDYGYVFGIDGAGYSFYEAHWLPLYKARGFHWHDPETVKEESK